MNSLKLFLFDLDGTLVSTGGCGIDALNRTFSELFKIEHPTKGMRVAGKTDPAIFREIIQSHLNRDMTPEELTLISSTYLRYLSIFVRYSKTYSILPGVTKFLEHLMTRGDILTGLGTGNLENGARIKLSRSNLSPYLPFGGFGSDSETRAEVLRIGHQRAEERAETKISPEAVFIIGDTPLDIAAAKVAGFRSVGVATGHWDEDALSQENPDYVLPNLSAAFRWLADVDKKIPGVRL